MCPCFSPLLQGILERLNAGEVVIGDGGFVFALEKRGYVKAGPWTPEATVTHPEAGKTDRQAAPTRYCIKSPIQPERRCTNTQQTCMFSISATAAQGVPEGRR